jgi:hypothetical protein
LPDIQTAIRIWCACIGMRSQKNERLDRQADSENGGNDDMTKMHLSLPYRLIRAMNSASVRPRLSLPVFALDPAQYFLLCGCRPTKPQQVKKLWADRRAL